MTCCIACANGVEFACSGTGLQVVQHFMEGDTIRLEPLDHVIFLTDIFADAPARQKCALLPSVAAYLGCGLCMFQVGFMMLWVLCIAAHDLAMYTFASILSKACCWS